MKLTTHRRPRLLHVAVLLLAEDPGKSNRRRVFGAVCATPGLHQRELGRRLDLLPGHVEHHLRHLEKAGLIHRQRQGRFVRYYPSAVPEAEDAVVVDRRHKPQLALLRQARPLQIIAHLLQEEPVRLGGLADKVGIAPGSLTYQVGKLEEVGLVERYREGNLRLVRLVDRDATIGLLLRYEPPADLVAGFEDLWGEVGF